VLAVLRRALHVLLATRRTDEGASDEAAERRRFEAERRDPDLVFRRYHDQLYRYVRVRVRSDDEAEDLVAQVFTEAVPALGRLRWQGRPVLAFLYTIAGRRLADRARRARPDAVDLDAVAEPAAPGGEQERFLAGSALLRAIEELPEEQRLAVYLQVVNGYAFAEVGLILGRTEKAAKGLVYRGLERVRAVLEAEGIAP
jgi:RNA polymerase sigma-70 factor (ECF subfamily)